MRGLIDNLKKSARNAILRTLRGEYELIRMTHHNNHNAFPGGPYSRTWASTIAISPGPFYGYSFLFGAPNTFPALDSAFLSPIRG